MLIYFSLVLLVFVFYIVFLYKDKKHSKKNTRLFLFCSFFCMSLVLGLRGVNVGEDTRHYSVELFNIFENISWKTIFSSPKGVVWSAYGEKIEPLFAILYKVVQVFTNNGQVFLFVVALITCWLFARFIYRNISDSVFFATLVFLCDALFMGSFNGIRQMMALSVTINCYEYMEKKEYGKVLILMLTGILIHNSAIIMGMLMLLFLFKNRRLGIIVIATSSFSLVVLMPIIARIVSKIIPKYSAYFNNNYWTNEVHGVLLLWCFLIVICIFMFCTGIRDNEEFFGIIGAILYIVIELIGLKISAFTRISYYFRSYLMMLFPSCAKKINKDTRIIYYVVVFILLIAEYYRYACTPVRQYLFYWQ